MSNTISKSTIKSNLILINGEALQRGVSQFATAKETRKFLTQYAAILWRQYKLMVKLGATEKQLAKFADRWSFNKALRAIKRAVRAQKIGAAMLEFNHR